MGFIFSLLKTDICLYEYSWVKAHPLEEDDMTIFDWKQSAEVAFRELGGTGVSMLVSRALWSFRRAEMPSPFLWPPHGAWQRLHGRLGGGP